MARKPRRPKARGIYILPRPDPGHPDYLPSLEHRILDNDHQYRMVKIDNTDLMSVMVRSGTDPTQAATVLRQWADLIEEHGDELLALELNQGGVVVDGIPQTGPEAVHYDKAGSTWGDGLSNPE